MYRRMTEDEWWDAFCERQEKAETKALAFAEELSDEILFDTEEERAKFVENTYYRRLSELLDE